LIFLTEYLQVLEHAPFKSLDVHLRDPEKLKQISWSVRIQIGLNIANALKFMHSNHYVHQDLKVCEYSIHLVESHSAVSLVMTHLLPHSFQTANVLVFSLTEEPYAKLCDFGMSHRSKSDNAVSFISSFQPQGGTWPWVAPERISVHTTTVTICCNIN
jgi:serine/threonine protein kinase